MSITFTIEQEKKAVYWWTKTLTPGMQNELFAKYNIIFQYLYFSDLTIQDIAIIHSEETKRIKYIGTPREQIAEMFYNVLNPD